MQQPGWYPDPSGARQYRYFDGKGWTAQTRPVDGPPGGGQPPSGYPQSGASPQPQGGYPPGPQGGYGGYPPHGGPPAGQGGGYGGYPPAGGQPYGGPGGTNKRSPWPFVALGVVLLAAIGVGAFFLIGGLGDDTTQASTSPSAVAADPSTQAPSPTLEPTEADPEPAEPTTAEPAPSESVEPTQPAEPTGPAESTAPVESEEPALQADDPAALIGTALTPATCIGDAQTGSSVEEDGYIMSGQVGLPMVEGFSLFDVPFMWYYEASGQSKYFTEDWVAFISIGQLRDDLAQGEPLTAAVESLNCIVGSPAAYGDPVRNGDAIITDVAADDDGGYTVTARVPITGIEGVPADIVSAKVFDIGEIRYLRYVVYVEGDTETEAAIAEYLTDG